MTKQEVFNKSYLGLASQGFRQCKSYGGGFGGGGYCRLTNNEGMHCAIGWLDPDKLPPTLIGGSGVAAMSSHVIRVALAQWPQLLAELQACHDMRPEPTAMRRCLVKLAKEEGLTVPDVPVVPVPVADDAG